jgi:signal transduction histidine kinase
MAQFACQEKKVQPVAKQNPFTELIEKGEYFERKLQFDSAYFYCFKAKSYVEPNSEQAAFTSLKLAHLQNTIGDYFGSEETITEALKNYEGDTYLPYLYNLMAVNYHKLKNTEESIHYYQNALSISKVPLDKIIYYNNIGLLYIEKKEYHKALELYKPLLADTILQQNQLEFARVMDNFGFTEFKLNRTTAINHLNTAFQIRDSLQDDIGLIASHMHLSEYYQKSNNQFAHKYALKAYNAAQKAKSPDDELEALKWLIQLSSPEYAKPYYEKYIRLNDSLTNTRSKAKNQFAKVKYDAKKATQEVIKYKNQKLILLVIIGLIIIIVYLLFRLYQYKSKRKLQQSTYLTETRISKRIHDELANDVFNTMTFTQTQNLENPISKEALLDNLEHIYQRTRDISKENSDIRTDENYEPDLFQMIDGYGDSNLNVIRKINEPIHWQKITSEKKITLQRVIQEFLINTKKHSEATLVIIDFSEDKKNISVTYTDNGIGIKSTQQRKSGLQNAENRILAVKGSITFDQTIQKGFKVTVVIPK